MNEVIIPIKLAGLGEMKAELKQIKSDLITATDPAEIERLSTRAGELNQKLKDTNKTIKNFSTGSTVQQVGNQISGIKDSLMNLDFKKAATQVTAFTATVNNFKVTDLTKGLGLLTSAVGKLGAQFLKIGMQLLVNPLFLLVVVIVAIVLAFTVWEDKLGKFGTALKIAFFGIYILVEAVKLLIESFKMLTDWLGLTSYAADDNAERVKAASEKSIEASKKRTEQISQSYEHEIAMAKIAGKDTVKLELEKSIKLQNEAQARIKYNRKTYQAMKHMDDEEAIKKRRELSASIKADNDLIKAGVNQRLQINAQANKDDTDQAAAKAKEAAAAAAAAYKERLAKQKEAAANRLAAERQIEDLRIAAIKDAAVREGEALTEKYDRLRADLLTDATKNATEKAALLKAFNLAETQEKDKMTETALAAAKQKENEAYQALNALKISNMAEGEAKIAAQQQVAYQASINAAKEKYGADSAQFAEFQEQLRIADEATTKVRSDKKIADQQALLDSLNNLALTDDQRKIMAIEAQYLKEQELANGNAETLLALENKHKADIEKVENDAAIERIEKEKQVRDAKLTFAKDTVDGLTNLGGLLIKDQKKLEKFNKASALIQIGIDTAKAISALVAAANTNPLNGVTGGGAGIAQFASGIIQIATNIAKAKNLLTSPSTPVSAGGDTGGGDTGGGSNTATMIPQAAQLFGSSNNANTMTAGGDSSGGGTNMMVTAVVSETQITNVQKKINMINKNSEL
jgi:hypothetical protein